MAGADKNASADGLRGLAALNVVLCHFAAAFLPFLLHGDYPGLFAAAQQPSVLVQFLSSPLATVAYNGHFPVLIFFVLSGYVLTLPIYQRPAPEASRLLERRLLGRYLRLNLPIFVAIGLAWLAYASGAYANVAAAARSGSVHWLASFYPEGLTAGAALRDGLYGAIAAGSGTFIPPLWSLKVEFIGSLYLLTLGMLFPRRLRLAILAAAPLLYLLHREDAIYYYAILGGALLHGARLRALGMALLVLPGLYFGAFQFEHPWYAFLPHIRLAGTELWDIKTFYNALGAVCLTAAVVRGFGARLLMLPAVQFLGRISFALYLLHFIVLCSLSARVYLMLAPGLPGLLLNFALYLGLSLGLAALFTRLVDQPAIALSHRFAAWAQARLRPALR